MTKQQELITKVENNEMTREDFFKEFTNRMFLEEVQKGNNAWYVVEKAQQELEKMDKANEKRKQRTNKTQQENMELLKQVIAEFNGKEVLASEVGAFLDVSTQKATAILRVGINVELVEQKDNTVKSKPKLYVIKGTTENIEEEETEEEDNE